MGPSSAEGAQLSDILPISEFRITKDNAIQPTYCHRCLPLRNRDYHCRVREAEPTASSPIRQLLDTMRTEATALASQIDVGDEAQITDLADSFGARAAELVVSDLQWYAGQREQLPKKVHNQRQPPKLD